MALLPPGTSWKGIYIYIYIYTHFSYTQAILVGYLFQHQQFEQRELSSAVKSQKLSSPKFGTRETPGKILDSHILRQDMFFCSSKSCPALFPMPESLGGPRRLLFNDLASALVCFACEETGLFQLFVKTVR